MDQAKRRLIVILCMHRSGSSLATNILDKLGMSLGPFDLLGARVGNPHGHYESLAFVNLNRQVLEWAFGFREDAPEDPETLARFLGEGGAWPVDRSVPKTWLEEGGRIVRALAESGSISGFKDPRTVLTWPFWRQVFQTVEDIEIQPVMLVRSPHEIAMSLCVRANKNVGGALPYWTALDLTDIHLTRMRLIAEEFPEKPPVARFATPCFWDDMRKLVDRCGLTWDDKTAEQVYDPSSVHQLPAIVTHPAQRHYDELCGGRATFDPESNSSRLAEDARRVETEVYRQLIETREQLERLLKNTQRVKPLLAVTDASFGAASNAKKRLSKILRKLRQHG